MSNKIFTSMMTQPTRCWKLWNVQTCLHHCMVVNASDKTWKPESFFAHNMLSAILGISTGVMVLTEITDLLRNLWLDMALMANPSLLMKYILIYANYSNCWIVLYPAPSVTLASSSIEGNELTVVEGNDLTLTCDYNDVIPSGSISRFYFGENSFTRIKVSLSRFVITIILLLITAAVIFIHAFTCL